MLVYPYGSLINLMCIPFIKKLLVTNINPLMTHYCNACPRLRFSVSCIDFVRVTNCFFLRWRVLFSRKYVVSSVGKDLWWLKWDILFSFWMLNGVYSRQVSYTFLLKGHWALMGLNITSPLLPIIWHGMVLSDRSTTRAIRSSFCRHPLSFFSKKSPIGYHLISRINFLSHSVIHA